MSTPVLRIFFTSKNTIARAIQIHPASPKCVINVMTGVRTRPYEAVDGLQRIIEAQRDLSFPSGHTGSSFAAAVVIFLTCPRKIGVPALILAFLIMFSRLYVGVHYPTDVLAGMITGTLIAVLVCRVYQKKHRKVLES